MNARFTISLWWRGYWGWRVDCIDMHFLYSLFTCVFAQDTQWKSPYSSSKCLQECRYSSFSSVYLWSSSKSLLAHFSPIYIYIYMYLSSCKHTLVLARSCRVSGEVEKKIIITEMTLHERVNKSVECQVSVKVMKSPVGSCVRGMRGERSRCGPHKGKELQNFGIGLSVQTISQAVGGWKACPRFRFIIHPDASLFKPVSVSINICFIYHSDALHLNLAGRISRYGLPRVAGKKKQKKKHPH